MPVAYAGARSFINVTNFEQDAMHVRKNHTLVEGNNIIDPYKEELFSTAHRDGLQIIPYKAGEPYYHFAGGISKGIVIKNNFIYSENHLQGIFASDGGHTDLQIIRNHVVTESVHKITIAGFFSGKIKDNRSSDLSLCNINLLPLRIGGNPDGEFNVWIIHFRGVTFKYDPLKNIIETKPYNHVSDNRTGNLIRNPKDIYLHSFHYLRFRAAVNEVALTPYDIRELALDFGKQDT